MEEYVTVPVKRRRQTTSSDVKAEYKRLCCEIMDTLTFQMEHRFKAMDKLKFLELLNSIKVCQYKNTFPNASHLSLRESYGQYFDIVRLQNELAVMYIFKDFEDKSILDMLKFMHANDLTDAMVEAHKLCTLVLTIPSTTATVERTFSALKGIKTYLRNPTEQTRLSGLFMTSIERKLLSKLKSRDTYDRVKSLLRTPNGLCLQIK